MDQVVTVGVMYTCHACGITNRTVPVPQRKEADDLVQWVDAVGLLIGNDHRRISPLCSSEHVDMKIPNPPNAKYIGEAIRQ